MLEYRDHNGEGQALAYIGPDRAGGVLREGYADDPGRTLRECDLRHPLPEPPYVRLFKMQVRFARRRRGRLGRRRPGAREETRKDAEQHIATRYHGSTLEQSVELKGRKHFVLADIVDE